LVSRDSETGEVKISGKVFLIKQIDGMELFETNNQENLLIVIVDPMKKFVTTVKNSYKPFW
jgi:hypothetical protein